MSSPNLKICLRAHVIMEGRETGLFQGTFHGSILFFSFHGNPFPVFLRHRGSRKRYAFTDAVAGELRRGLHGKVPTAQRLVSAPGLPFPSPAVPFSPTSSARGAEAPWASSSVLEVSAASTHTLILGQLACGQDF